VALLRFWNEGAFWRRAEIEAFRDALLKLPK
jgi:hypothetical protein